jgi:S13-like protein
MSVPTDPVPERTLAQRRDALRKANRIRTERARLKERMKARRESPLDLLLEPPQYIESMKVQDFLLATPKYGKVKTKKVLQLARVSPTKTVGGMTSRQRTELVWRMNGGSGEH